MAERTETIRFRCTPEERVRYEEAAGGKRKLSEWIRQAAEFRLYQDISLPTSQQEADLHDLHRPEREAMAKGKAFKLDPRATLPMSKIKTDRTLARREVTPIPKGGKK